ncbi:sensor histidine kinase [Actinomadura sp. 3N407]|uniref:sensor histidine kinase n=1 Tax=Actinomadura sp. 3N407 TaxID=3457423 RepID=UPI003FCED08A
MRTGLPAMLGLVPLTAFLALMWIALPWLPSAVKPLRALANAERRRAGRILGREIPEPYRPPLGEGLREARRLARSPVTWRDAAWMAVHGLTGLQAQLVAAALRLGLADRRFEADPDAARKLFLEAREGVEEALTQLRTVIRGIYPPILSDRGLAGALGALAAGQPIPIELDVDMDGEDRDGADIGGAAGGRAPAAVEAAAYFVVAEALTNVAKHSGARHGRVTVRREPARLTITVRDDGKGGADPDRGSGLAGIRRRVAALDGAARIDSPDGRGTTLTVDLPCGS